MPFENPEDYILDDSANRITIEDKVNLSVDEIPNNELVMLRKDFGLDFFAPEDFINRYKYRPISQAGSGAQVVTTWMRSNDVDDYFTHLASKTFFSVQCNLSTVNATLILIEEQSGFRRNTASFNLDLGVQYWIEVKRVGDLLTLTAYLDAAYTVVHNTVSWTIFQTTQAFSIFYMINNWNNPSSDAIGNFTCGEYNLNIPLQVDVLGTLIDKQDNFEIVRNQIALILATEVDNQMILAIAASKDPALWDMKIFVERSNPWEQYLNEKGVVPIINVWYDNGNFPGDKGDVVKIQHHEAVINIDCIGFGISEEDTETGGHKPGDKLASLSAQKAIRFVRNILMAALNVNLQLPGLVGKRWPQSITAFQPSIDDRPILKTWGMRLALRVEFLETSPQFEPETLELVSVDLKYDPAGAVIVEADYDYPL